MLLLNLPLYFIFDCAKKTYFLDLVLAYCQRVFYVIYMTHINMSHKSKLYVVRYQQRVNVQVRHHSNSFLCLIQNWDIGLTEYYRLAIWWRTGFRRTIRVKGKSNLEIRQFVSEMGLSKIVSSKNFSINQAIVAMILPPSDSDCAAFCQSVFNCYFIRSG